MKENCAECKHHDVFWRDSGCNLLNNGERCKFEPKVITNAERIRAMSDEELAVLSAHETYRTAKPVFDMCGYGITEEFIFAKRLEWLQQPVE